MAFQDRETLETRVRELEARIGDQEAENAVLRAQSRRRLELTKETEQRAGMDKVCMGGGRGQLRFGLRQELRVWVAVLHHDIVGARHLQIADTRVQAQLGERLRSVEEALARAVSERRAESARASEAEIRARRLDVEVRTAQSSDIHAICPNLGHFCVRAAWTAV